MSKENALVELQHTLYDSRNPTRRWLHRTRRDWILYAIRRFSAGRSQALEVGPGSGVYVPHLCKLFARVCVSDCEEAYLGGVRGQYGSLPGLNIIVDDITASEMQPASFDLILCSEVVEHIPASDRAFVQLRRLLRPDGVLVLSTPQKYSILEMVARVALSPVFIWLTRKIYREPVLETGHINLLTEKQLRAQLDAAGFDVKESFKTGLYLPLIAELLGVTGQRWQEKLERVVRGSRLDGMLWIQYIIATPR